MKVAWHEVPGIDPMTNPSRGARYDLVAPRLIRDLNVVLHFSDQLPLFAPSPHNGRMLCFFGGLKNYFDEKGLGSNGTIHTVPPGRVRFATKFQALRARLPSFSPSGTHPAVRTHILLISSHYISQKCLVI